MRRALANALSWPRNRMREFFTSGSVGGGGSNPPSYPASDAAGDCPGSQFKWKFLTPFCVSPPATIAS
jgi:hypothetical protein